MSFRDYEADYQSQLDSIKKDINTLSQSLLQQNRGAAKVYNRYDIVKRLLDQHSKMKSSLAGMEFESNEGPADQVALRRKRLADMKKEAFNFEKEINRLKQESSAADQADLINRVTQDPSSSSGAAVAGPAGNNNNTKLNSTDSQLAEMTKNTTTMNKGTSTLTNALRYVVRMNELGEATLVELRRQDETTDRLMMNNAETDAQLTGAQRILRDMKLIAMKNNIILAGTVIVLVIIIVAILYYKFGRPLAASWSNSNGGSNSGSSTPSPSSVIGAPSVAPSPSSSSSLTSFSLDSFRAVAANGIYSLQGFIPTN